MRKALILIIIALTLGSCSQEASTHTHIIEINTDGIDKLPPPTQTGANTIGCRLDGKVSVSVDGFSGCRYRVNNGEYYFYISLFGANDTKIVITSSYEQLIKGQTYILYEYDDEYPSSLATTMHYWSSTSQVETGKLTITKLDEVKKIVSGTFWFDAPDHDGKLHKIRDGRFDFKYADY